MDGTDFRGAPPGNVVTTATPANDRKMLATADTTGSVVARSGAGSAFVTNASGDYIGIDNSAALGVNYPNPGECTFRGSAITIEAP